MGNNQHLTVNDPRYDPNDASMALRGKMKNETRLPEDLVRLIVQFARPQMTSKFREDDVVIMSSKGIRECERVGRIFNIELMMQYGIPRFTYGVVHGLNGSETYCDEANLQLVRKVGWSSGR